MARRSFYLGRYNCVELLSEGPLGETFRAKIYGVAGFEKQFVVRRIPMALCSDDAFARRLVDAATRYAAIDSDRVARVHDVNVQGSQYYIAVDLIRGVDLATLKRSLKEKNERLSSEAALLVALELAETIAQLHARQDLDTAGIRHLGLSPDTVVATPEGELRLLDVGLMEALITPGWALADRGVATLQYLAPEVLRGESTAGTADIFSIGVILYELLTGDAPYSGEDGAELVGKMQAGPPQPKYLDPRSATVLARALAANPAQRFPSMDAFAEALRTLLVPRVQRARNDLGTQVRRLLGRPTMRLGSGSSATPNAEQPPLAALKPSSPFSPQKTPPPLIPNSRLPKPPPPRGPSLEPVPPRNTFAGVGADDAAISIEMSELPGPMTEKAMPVFVEPGDGSHGDKGTHSSPTAHAMPAVQMPVNDRTEPMVRVPEDELVDESEPTEKMNSDRHQMPPALPTPPVGTPLPTYGNLTGPLPMLVPDASDPSKEIEIEPERMRQMDIDAESFPSTMRVAPIKKPAPKRSPWPLLLVGAIGLGAAGGTGLYVWKKQQSAVVVQPTSKPLEAKPAAVDPKPVAAEPKPVAAEPKPVAAEPKPVAAEPKPVAAEPKPLAAEPKPVVAEPKPAAAATTQVTTTPPGAAVFLAGKRLGATPLELPNSNGELIVVAEGYRLHKQMLSGRGTTYDVALTPAKLSSELAGGAGLKVRCKTAGVFRIFVDGQDTGMTCPNETRISIKAGAHKIGLFSPTSGATTETSANVKGGSSSTRLYVKN